MMTSPFIASGEDRPAPPAPSGVWPDVIAPPMYDDSHADWRDPALPNFQRIWELGREVGYAIGIHGSLKRDVDLIAAPWTEHAVSPDALIAHLCRGLDAREVGKREPKPLGRVSCNLQVNAYVRLIDLSVCPREFQSEATQSVWQSPEELLYFKQVDPAAYPQAVLLPDPMLALVGSPAVTSEEGPLPVDIPPFLSGFTIVGDKVEEPSAAPVQQPENPDAVQRKYRQAVDALETAWGVIANVNNGDWSKQSPVWRQAANNFREDYYAVLDLRTQADVDVELAEKERKLRESQQLELLKDCRRELSVAVVCNDVMAEFVELRRDSVGRTRERYGRGYAEVTDNYTSGIERLRDRSAGFTALIARVDALLAPAAAIPLEPADPPAPAVKEPVAEEPAKTGPVSPPPKDWFEADITRCQSCGRPLASSPGHQCQNPYCSFFGVKDGTEENCPPPVEEPIPTAWVERGKLLNRYPMLCTDDGVTRIFRDASAMTVLDVIKLAENSIADREKEHGLDQETVNAALAGQRAQAVQIAKKLQSWSDSRTAEYLNKLLDREPQLYAHVLQAVIELGVPLSKKGEAVVDAIIEELDEIEEEEPLPAEDDIGARAFNAVVVVIGYTLLATAAVLLALAFVMGAISPAAFFDSLPSR